MEWRKNNIIKCTQHEAQSHNRVATIPKINLITLISAAFFCFIPLMASIPFFSHSKHNFFLHSFWSIVRVVGFSVGLYIHGRDYRTHTQNVYLNSGTFAESLRWNRKNIEKKTGAQTNSIQKNLL